MVKKVLSILVAMVVLFALCACNDNSDLLTKIEELESMVQSQADKITELEGKNKEQTDKLSELEGKNKQQTDKLSELEGKNKQQSDKLSELEETNKEQADEITDLEKQIADLLKEQEGEYEKDIMFKENSYTRTFEYNDSMWLLCKMLTLVNSLDELKDLCNEHNNPAFREDYEDYIDNDYPEILLEKLREYDDTFFADKSLIIYADVARSGHYSYSIKKIYVEEGELIIDVKVTIWMGPAVSAYVPWTLLVEVNKEDLVGVKDIKYTKEYFYEYPEEA